MSVSRRRFLQAAASAVAAPFLLPSHVQAAAAKANSRLTMGFVGMGYQARYLLQAFLGLDVDVLAVCDVDAHRRDDAKQRVEQHNASRGRPQAKCDAYDDFRKIIECRDIDTVCIATPDHWHAIVTVAALASGKDVYCEKPLTHTIDEAIRVMRAVDANHRVLQTGSMQRSMQEFRVACELVRNGAIGKLQRVECSFGDAPVRCDLPEERLEPGLDWDCWLGPAPLRGYSSVLSPRGVTVIFPHGDLPRIWRGRGGRLGRPPLRHCPMGPRAWTIAARSKSCRRSNPGDKRGVTFVYANGVTLEHNDGFGVDLFGSEGEIQVNRGKFTFRRGKDMIAAFTDRRREKNTSCAAEVQKAQRAFLRDAKVKLTVSKNHLWNFLDCVRSRSKPITSEQVGGRSAICCHLMNQAYFHGQRMLWDPATFAFVGGTGDPAWLTHPYRSPWQIG